MGKYQYHLFKGSRKWVCPECGKKTFVCYVDDENNVLHESVGRCDREQKCQYHYTPKQYFKDNGWMEDAERTPHPRPKRQHINQAPPPTYIDPWAMKCTLGWYKDNNLIAYLDRLFEQGAVSDMIWKYFIGTSDHWQGSTVFWQVDRFGRIRTGKVMQYDRANGKRVKEPSNRVSWMHKVLGMQDFNLSQCLFGEHLLSSNPDAKVVVVESEKTAVILSGLLQGCVCLAVGGCGNLSPKICEPLRGRDVVLLPDNGKYQKWSEKGGLLTMCRQVTVADMMERYARKEGDDAADLISIGEDGVPRYDAREWQDWGERLLYHQ